MRVRPSIPLALTLAVLVMLCLAPPSTQFATSPVSGQIPISFEVNQGQADSQVRFLARGPGYSLFLTPQEALMALSPAGHGTPASSGSFSPPVPNSFAPASARPPTLVGMRYLNANPQPEVTGEHLLSGIVNYLLGNDPAQWHTNIPTYAQVSYHNLYPGIDMVYDGNQGHLKYSFIVAPGGDLTQIHLGFTGVNHLSLDARGDLLLSLADGVLPEAPPLVYQEINGGREEIDSRYVIQGAADVSFALGAYDTSRPLVIDPIVLFSTYLGGSANDYSTALAVDGAGNTYLTGSTSSSNFSLRNPLQPTFGGGTSDAFVTKMNAAGTAVVYSTYLGGSGADMGESIAIDSTGDAYVTGVTSSTNFPTKNALQPTFGGGESDTFVAELNAAGTGLVYSTYLGGGGADWGAGIAVDSAGNAYVTGGTGSGNFPTHNPLQSASAGVANAFVAEVSAAGAGLVYSTYLGGGNYDYAAGIAVDGSGDAYITGTTHSSNFPTHNPLQSSYAGSADAFVAKLGAAGTGLVYSTYLGGSDSDGGFGIAVDSAGNAYIAGSTLSANFPTQNPLQAANAGGGDAFVAKINGAGGVLVYSTYLGGSNADGARGIAVDSAGNAYITGSTSSANFPMQNALQPTNAGSADAFVSRLNDTGNLLLYSSYLGGKGNDVGNGIVLDSAGNVYVAGGTASADFPTLNPAQAYGGMEDGFLIKMNLTAPARFQVNPGNVTLITTPGASPGQQTLTVSNAGDTPLNWTANSLPAWVSVSPASGMILGGSMQTLTLTFNTPSTTPQTYSTNLVLSDPNASNSPISVPITVVSANVSKTWFFAEGYTGPGFSEWLTIANPNSVTAHVNVAYYRQGTTNLNKSYVVGPTSRYTLLVNNEVGNNQQVSMTVTADQPIIAERPMYFTYSGIPGGSDVLGATSLAQHFDFGYLDTTANHATWLTILNQNSAPMNVTINYYPAAGGNPITVQHIVAANSRGTVFVNGDVPAGSYSALVSLDQPGLVERPMYLIDGQTHYTGAADVVGVANPTTDWDFAEGYTSSTFAERYILSNPNTTTAATATVTFFLSGGGTKTATVTIPAGGQQVISANAVLGSGGVNNSAHVSASQPILAERFISFTYVGPVGVGQITPIPGASDVLGAPAPSNLFYFAEGYTGGSFGEYLTIENPEANTADVDVTFLPTNGAGPISQVYSIAPSSRFTLYTNGVMGNQSFSMVVESNIAIVAERPMYFNYYGQTGGSDVVGYEPPAPLYQPPPPTPTPTGTNTATATDTPPATSTPPATPTNTPPPVGVGAITGQVTDSSGNPIAGAQVTTSPATITATTDSRGNYTLANLNAGLYSVVAAASGYNTNYASNVYITNNLTVPANISLSPIPPYTSVDNFTRPNQAGWGAASDGHTWSDDNATYPGATSSIQGNQGFVDTYTLDTDLDQWMGDTYTNELISADFNIGQYGNDPAHHHGPRLLGRVTDSTHFISFNINPDNSSLELWIQNGNNNWKMLTQVGLPSRIGINAWYHAKMLVVGNMVYGKVWAYGAAEPNWMISSRQGPNIILASGMGGVRSTFSDIYWTNFSVRGLTAITGTVTDSGKNPITGATVTDGTGQTTTTDANGYYWFIEPNANATYPVTVSDTGYTTQSQNVTVTNLTSATQNFTLT